MEDLRAKPFGEMIAMLRSTLKQAEHDLTLHPNDPEAIDLCDSIKRMLADLESNADDVAKPALEDAASIRRMFGNREIGLANGRIARIKECRRLGF